MTNAAQDDVEHEGRTVGVTAALLGVTVRALHHWDEIGLVRASARTSGGYRLYTGGDISRARRVLVYRELGVALDEIGQLLDAPASATDSLRRQRDRVRAYAARLNRTAEALDRLISAREEGLLLSDEEQVEIFGERWQPDHVDEARERWGDTGQWAEYAERSADRTAEDWRRIAADVRALEADMAAAHRGGISPGSDVAGELAERHRVSMDVYFDCSHEMHVCLGRGYVADPRFIDYYDEIEPGLAHWLRDAIEANARAHGVDPSAATWN